MHTHTTIVLGRCQRWDGYRVQYYIQEDKKTNRHRVNADVPQAVTSLLIGNGVRDIVPGAHLINNANTPAPEHKATQELYNQTVCVCICVIACLHLFVYLTVCVTECVCLCWRVMLP